VELGSSPLAIQYTLRRELERLKEYDAVADIGEIARRYFAMNSFDGILTILGVLAATTWPGCATRP